LDESAGATTVTTLDVTCVAVEVPAQRLEIGDVVLRTAELGVLPPAGA